MVRNPAVRGMFYNSDKASLCSQLKGLFFHRIGPGILQKDCKGKIIGIISPHAGYEYSGPTAASAFARIGKNSPKLFIIIGPNHTGTGPRVSVWTKEAWRTPLGDAKIAQDVAEKLVLCSKFAKADESAHKSEHSIEVQVPFLQFLFGDNIRIVPVCMSDQSLEAAKDISDAILSLGRDAVIIASSDFTHYESKEDVEKKDFDAIRAIESLDTKLFYETIEKSKISMCGFGAIAVLMLVAKAKGGKISKISHSTSGDITGDNSSVVGYAALEALL